MKEMFMALSALRPPAALKLCSHDINRVLQKKKSMFSKAIQIELPLRLFTFAQELS